MNTLDCLKLADPHWKVAWIRKQLRSLSRMNARVTGSQIVGQTTALEAKSFAVVEVLVSVVTREARVDILIYNIKCASLLP